jgi:hypothetical protein
MAATLFLLCQKKCREINSTQIRTTKKQSEFRMW